MQAAKNDLNLKKIKKETILIKISGAALKNDEDSSIISVKKIDALVNQISQIFDKYNVAIVVGGGNIWRGDFGKQLKINDQSSDYIGMLATVMNANLLSSALESHNLPASVFSAINVEALTEPVDFKLIQQRINHSVCIFAGGIGEPYFTTDTNAVLRAIQLKATKLLIGKNGVDGVYSSDPKLGGNPVFFEKLTYDYAVAKSLKIMDKTAFSLASEHNLEMIVFNIESENSILNALKSNTRKTIIS